MSQIGEAEGKVAVNGSNRHSSDIDKGNTLEDIAPELLTWDSPEDQDNPRNWPAGEKIFHVAVPALFGFIMYVVRIQDVTYIRSKLMKLQNSRNLSLCPSYISCCGRLSSWKRGCRSSTLAVRVGIGHWTINIGTTL